MYPLSNIQLADPRKHLLLIYFCTDNKTYVLLASYMHTSHWCTPYPSAHLLSTLLASRFAQSLDLPQLVQLALLCQSEWVGGALRTSVFALIWIQGSLKVVLMETDVYRHYTEDITIIYVDICSQPLFAFTKSILRVPWWIETDRTLDWRIWYWAL